MILGWHQPCALRLLGLGGLRRDRKECREGEHQRHLSSRPRGRRPHPQQEPGASSWAQGQFRPRQSLQLGPECSSRKNVHGFPSGSGVRLKGHSGTPECRPHIAAGSLPEENALPFPLLLYTQRSLLKTSTEGRIQMHLESWRS